MDKIRDAFHKISNHLNNISIIAGLAKEEMKSLSIEGKEKTDMATHVRESLEKIENNVSSLAKKLDELRSLVSPAEGAQE
ncbi:MAG: hypothetical protein AB1629_01745 [Candidatus Omnitrophota bacterium]